MRLLKEQDYNIPLQFVNMKSWCPLIWHRTNKYELKQEK
jgi:hypothetical protein